MRMPFGKFKGERLADIPDDYLAWLLTRDLREPLKTAVEYEARRRGQHDERRSDHEINVNPKVVEALVAAGLRALARKYHPDAGGNHDDMVAINEAASWLRGQVRR
jgi:hypothetical protein